MQHVVTLKTWMESTCYFLCRCIVLIKITSTPTQKCVNNVKFWRDNTQHKNRRTYTSLFCTPLSNINSENLCDFQKQYMIPKNVRKNAYLR